MSNYLTQILKDRPGYYDNHYTVNEETGEMTFHTDNEMYAIERDAFRAHGLDIEKIKDFDTYVRLGTITRFTTRAIFEARMKSKYQNKKNLSLVARAILASIDGNHNEAIRLLKLSSKKRKLGLKAV